MNRPSTFLAVSYFFVSFLAGVFLGASFPPTWGLVGGWLHEWQTIITGALAVSAAFVTVAQMRQSDERAENRHRDLISLGLRSDALSAARAFHPQYSELIFANEGIVGLISEIKNTDRKNLVTGFVVHLDKGLKAAIDLCREILTTEQMLEAKHIMDATTFDAYANSLGDVKDLGQMADKVEALTAKIRSFGEGQGRQRAVDNLEQWFDNNLDDLLAILHELVEQNMVLARGLNRLNDDYADVEINIGSGQHD